MDGIDAGATKWLYKTAHQNFWRVASWYDIDDLIQDGFMTFFRIRQRYPKAKTPAHIMRLFQVSYINHIHKLANKRTRSLAEATFADAFFDQDEQAWFDKLVDVDSSDMTLLIAHAPEHIKAALRALITTDPKKLRAPYRRRKKGREDFNERLCKLAGLDSKHVDLEADIKAYLAG